MVQKLMEVIVVGDVVVKCSVPGSKKGREGLRKELV